MADPSVFVLGAQKSGTTTVADLLAAQPEVFVPSIKETYFFCDETLWEKGIDWYRQEFYGSGPAQEARLCCDATPFYLASDAALERLAAYTGPEARFVVVLRDPVARAYSAYWHQRRLGNEDLSFEAALEAEPARIAAARAEGGRWWRHAYAEAGRYSGQLERAFDLLGRDRILILSQPDLRDARQLEQRLREHLGLPPRSSSGSGALQANRASMPRSQALQRFVTGRNPIKQVARKVLPRELRTRIGRTILKSNLKAQSYPPMRPETQARLQEMFAADIAALSALGVDADPWKRAG
ncbi:hypothetical protein OCH239_01285 [Roseivivax halodurans JCM 10272]|uniref:Sulfotransferase domain-containing protein n=1 Tax=Roseivivax halodurans JCM 10272 TaxID=1449350 RepID=X7ELB1_9RHOB|nr:sulfotransferase [Roseivivax halodurans]ETX16722.1 hypothetical protein OCH239_01285 [Roseivivax halodurans JCM 10272]